MANPNTKRWMVTVFGEEDPVLPIDGVGYATWGKETCPDTGRVHYHLYLRFVKKCRMSTLKNRLANNTAHCEPAQGSEKECRDYCWAEGDHASKAGHFLAKGPEIGVFDGTIRQGKRSDLDAIADDVKKGATERDIAEKYSADFMRYSSGIRNFIAVVAPKPPLTRDVLVTLLWGPTGTGKTHRCLTAYPDLYSVKPGRDPWGLYRGETTILFDEFDWEKWTLQDMNRYLDKWRVMLDARYNDRYGAWTRVLICANSPPQSWWPNAAPLLRDAFMRRIRGQTYLVERQEPDLNGLISANDSEDPLVPHNPYLYAV